MDAELTTSGAIFTDGDQIVRQELASMLLTTATEAQSRVRQRLDVVLRNPTGFYRSRVTSEVTPTLGRVHDSNVIYGPWLEGVGSRNARTRFKGYSTFRKIAQRIEQDAPFIVAADVQRMATRLES